MEDDPQKGLPKSRDALLFTPGPLTTSATVKAATLHDAGSWHFAFNEIVAWIRQQILRLAGVSREQGWECVPLQGSGTFGVEAVFATVIPPQGRLLILANGAYGERMVLMAQHLKLDHLVQRSREDQPPDPDQLALTLRNDPGITHVAAVHCETTTGLLNPIERLGPIVKHAGRAFIVDAMSSFGAIPIQFEAWGLDFLISSANKCIEGVPGFSFVIARRSALLANEGHSRSLSLDLIGQLRGFEKNGQFRYTPPTQSLLGFAQALRELEQEGGVTARGARYLANHETLTRRMRQLGFRSFLDRTYQSYIITSFYYPRHPAFAFDRFYRLLSEQGYIIYPGKISQAELFRIGSIGRIFPEDIEGLTDAIGRTLERMGIPVPLES